MKYSVRAASRSHSGVPVMWLTARPSSSANTTYSRPQAVAVTLAASAIASQASANTTAKPAL